MKREQVLAKLKTQVLKQFEVSFSTFLASNDASEYPLDQAVKVTPRNVSGLTYVQRDNYFRNGRDTCGFNPETGEGHSYGWYSLTKKIEGKLVLNNYRYSQQTAIHIRRTQDVLNDLGLDYMTIEAPKGLQDLDAALAYALNNQAKRYVNNKYGRDKVTSSYLKGLETPKGQAFKTLAKLGKRATKAMMLEAIAKAETARLARLEFAKKDRAEKKAMAQIEIVSDQDGAMHNRTDGTHIIAQLEIYARTWNDGKFCGYISDWDKREAVVKGFTKIYIHGSEARLLQVVNTPDLGD